MSELKAASLPNRGVLKVSGADAHKFLQGILTTDIDNLEAPTAKHTGLLSPQGKILFDFFVVAVADGYLLETGKAEIPDLMKRLTMYKLRADVTLSDVSAGYTVAALWGDGAASAADKIEGLAFIDPRREELGVRLLLTSDAGDALGKLQALPVSETDYDAHRIGNGVPEAGKDFPLGDTFPHEALYDQLGGVSFQKGCYVGQEVVSRMQHRSTARKRVVSISADAPLPETGTEIRTSSAAIGTLGTVAGGKALALLRLDRAAEALAKGETLQANETKLDVSLPSWATFKFPPEPTPKS